METIDTPVYSIIDTNASLSAVQNAIMQAEQSRGSFVSENIANIMENTSSPTFMTGFETEMDRYVSQYMNNTNSLNFQNEIYNTNMFMSQSMTLQEEQINHLSEKARNHIMRSRQKYQLKLYDIAYYNFVTNVLMYAIMIVAISGIMLSMTYKNDPPILSPTLTWSVIGVIVVVYLLIVLIYVRNNSNRRKTDWNKYNFGTYGAPGQSASCRS